jgi:single stranded DNA-binding protein
MFRVAVSGRREQEASFFTVIVWRAQAEHAAQSLVKGSRVVVVGRLQQRSWTAEDGSTRSPVEVVAEELGSSLRWATATPVQATKSFSERRQRVGQRVVSDTRASNAPVFRPGRARCRRRGDEGVIDAALSMARISSRRRR